MQKESIVLGVSGLIIGFLLGVLVGGKTMGGNPPALHQRSRMRRR